MLESYWFTRKQQALGRGIGLFYILSNFNGKNKVNWNIAVGGEGKGLVFPSRTDSECRASSVPSDSSDGNKRVIIHNKHLRLLAPLCIAGLSNIFSQKRCLKVFVQSSIPDHLCLSRGNRNLTDLDFITDPSFEQADAKSTQLHVVVFQRKKERKKERMNEWKKRKKERKKER